MRKIGLVRLGLVSELALAKAISSKHLDYPHNLPIATPAPCILTITVTVLSRRNARKIEPYTTILVMSLNESEPNLVLM